MVATTGAMALIGVAAHPVSVQCHKGNSLPGLRVIGLPGAAVRESSHRVRAACAAIGHPVGTLTLTVNLAPAALPKAGSGFDLPIALAVLAEVGILPADAVERIISFGELALDGRVRPVPGVLPVARETRDRGQRLLVAERAAPEARLIDGLDVIPIRSLQEAIEILRGETSPRPVTPADAAPAESELDLRDVRGQPLARRALEIAATGQHHLLMAGPPGCGKSLLARRLPSILPRLDVEAALEVAAIHSVAGTRAPDAPLSRRPPFGDPGPGVTLAGLVGGGAGLPRPGAMSLAHHGVLFIDELLEHPRMVLDALRQPLETGQVCLTRAAGVVRYPASVLMVAATNPCPCGHLGDSRRACRCRPDQIERYRGRLSGPLLDRIDIQIELEPVDEDALIGEPDGEPSAEVAARVLRARGRPGGPAAHLPVSQLRAQTNPRALRSLARAVTGLRLSARSFDRCLRVARTIADLDAAETVEQSHVDEAVAYRLTPVLGAA